jgi:hypothetical protein
VRLAESAGSLSLLPGVQTGFSIQDADMERFGDMQWAERSHGRVRGLERFVQIWVAIRFRLLQRFRARPRSIGCATPGEVERFMKEIELPKTTLVENASAFVAELGPAALTGHVLRTWAWGAVLALRDGLSFDSETFALAALLHDVALARRTPGVTCFAADGAGQAVSMLRDWGAPEALRAAVGDAICLHLRVDVPMTYGVEAHLVHAGSAIDVVGGARIAEIPADVRRAVLAKYPRGELKTFLLDVLRREQCEHPSSRIGLWVSMGFLKRIEAAPFREP